MQLSTIKKIMYAGGVSAFIFYSSVGLASTVTVTVVNNGRPDVPASVSVQCFVAALLSNWQRIGKITNLASDGSPSSVAGDTGKCAINNGTAQFRVIHNGKVYCGMSASSTQSISFQFNQFGPGPACTCYSGGSQISCGNQ